MANVRVEEVARAVAGVVGSDNDLLLVGQWVSQRWQELANNSTLRALRKIGELTIEGPETTGTVAATQGSKTVTGTGTAFAGQHVGMHIEIKNVWYEIANVASATSLTLQSEYAEDTVTGASFHIVQRRHRLADDARKLGTFVHMRLKQPLHAVSQIGLDMFIPSRFETNSVPRYVAEMSPDTDGTRRVEIYPFSSQQEIIHYMYWAKPTPLGFYDYIPGDIDTEALREGVLVDVYRNMANKFAQSGNLEQAAYYRNEYRSQETTWRNIHKQRLYQLDDGMDDLEFILMKNPAHPRRLEDRVIDNAYDQVWYT